MFSNQIFEQFIAVQNQSLELTQEARRISNENVRKLAEINFNAVKFLGSITQEYFNKFGMVHDPATLPNLMGTDEAKEILEYLVEYRSHASKVVSDGNQKLFAALGDLASHTRSDFENVVHGLTNNELLGAEPGRQAFRLAFDTFMQGCDQIAGTTREIAMRVEKSSGAST